MYFHFAEMPVGPGVGEGVVTFHLPFINRTVRMAQRTVTVTPPRAAPIRSIRATVVFVSAIVTAFETRKGIAGSSAVDSCTFTHPFSSK